MRVGFDMTSQTAAAPARAPRTANHFLGSPAMKSAPTAAANTTMAVPMSRPSMTAPRAISIGTAAHFAIVLRSPSRP